MISIFMLVSEIRFEMVYLQSYEASFSDMKYNCIRTVIEKFIPYFGLSMVFFGLHSVFKKFDDIE